MNQEFESKDPSVVSDAADVTTDLKNEKTEIVELNEIIRNIAVEHKSAIDEMTKLQREALKSINGVVYKQHEELEAFHRGSQREDKSNLLRAIAVIYSEGNPAYSATGEVDVAATFKRVISRLGIFLDGNGVRVEQSESGRKFDVSLMDTKEKFVLTTDDISKDGTIERSIRPGFSLYGEPLLLELVSVYRYVAPTKTELSSASVTEKIESDAQVDDTQETISETECKTDTTIMGVEISTSISEDTPKPESVNNQNLSNEGEEKNHG